MNKRPTSFAWLNVTQFLGAMNDNAFKLLLIFFLIQNIGVTAAQKAAGATGLTIETINAMANGIFAIPFLLFAALAGNLADRYSKQRIILVAKGLELFIMILGLILLSMGQTYALFAVLFVMAAQSTLFGPSKFGIIPELVERHRLAKSNGFMTACTYLAIIIGTALTPVILDLETPRKYALAACVSVVLALAGLFTATRIERTPPAGNKAKPSWIFVTDIARTLKRIQPNTYLFASVIGAAFFLHLGTLVQINIIPYGIKELDLSNARSGFLFLGVALGIGIGALISGWLSGRTVEVGMVPFGAAGIAFSTLAISVCSQDLIHVMTWMILLGVSAGLFIVPLNAYIQFASPRKDLGKILAASSFLSWIGVLLAAGLSILFQHLQLQAREVFVLVGILSLTVFFISAWLLKDFVVKFIAKCITRMFYRIAVFGADNVPVDGPALLISNHVSFVDAVLLSACLQRRIRFLMYRGYYEKPVWKAFFKLMGAIPISFEDGPRSLIGAFKQAREAMEDGYIVCVFAEGTLTKNGAIREFQPGFEKMVKGTQVPIIPVYLGGIWGSIFSYAHGKPLAKWPSQLPYPVRVHFGAALDSTTPAHEVRLAVQEMSAEDFNHRPRKNRTLGHTFVKTARINGSRKAMADSTGREVTFTKALTAAILIRSRLQTRWGEDEPYIGVFMPTTVAGALVNLAITLSGRIPVNLNYTSAKDSLASALEQTGIKRIITLNIFLEKLGNPDISGVEKHDLQELMGSPSTGEKITSLIKARLYPLSMLLPTMSGDDLATVIFSSGSTGTPKGVMLSHHNILSNIESFRMLVAPQKTDVICSPLPFFHSFGFTVGLWLPMTSGFTAVYHPNPVEANAIGTLAETHNASIIVATPTFLLGYIRKVKPEQFSTLRLVVVGAEKLKPNVADAFEKRFGVRPYEGYGATECAPVISVNAPDWDGPGTAHPMSKEGTAGAAIPGVCTKVLDPDNGALKDVDEEGLLWVKGPNVMQDYLKQKDKTEDVLVDGWYNTGDIVKIDADGFITITDRLSRFSKIGGEMIPHAGIEDALYELTHAPASSLAITAVPHDKKGEQIVLLHTPEAGSTEDLQQKIAKSDLPNLWKPSATNIRKIEKLPVLGSGKLDLKGLKQLALDVLAKT